MSGIVLGGARASSDVFERVGSPIRAKTSDEAWATDGEQWVVGAADSSAGQAGSIAL